MFDLTGKVAVVTGGNGGLGLAMARGLAQAGASIVIAARNEQKSAAAVAALTAQGHVAHAVTTDVVDEASIDALFRQVGQRHGRLDILVNNAGTSIRKMPEDFTLAEWHSVMDTNLTGMFLCCRAALPLMKPTGAGKVINIASVLATSATAYAAPYCTSKGAVLQFTRSIAISWAQHNIQANAVLPGFIDSDMTVQAREQVPGLHERVLGRVPARRWGQPQDLAGIAVFLASPASDFITGAAIPVDGGYSIA